jgi:hypothetical protein
LTAPLDKGRTFARTQPFLRLPGKLRILHLHREHELQAVPDIIGRELHAARQEVAELAELAQRIGKTGAQPFTCVPPSRSESG